MLTKDLLKTVIIILISLVVTIGSSIALNTHTADLIKANRENAATGEMAALLPGGKTFTDITATLTIDSASGVSVVYAENNGLGYVFKASSKGYSQIVEVTVGVTADGKVAGLSVNTNGDYAVKEPTINSYIGQDSTLTDVVHTGGATVSSGAVRAAVAAGFTVLAANDKISAGKKAIDQVFDELLLTVYPGFVIGKKSELEVSGNVTRALKANNGSGIICYVQNGDSKVLTVTNSDYLTLVYEAEVVDEKTQTYKLVEATSKYAGVVSEVSTYVEGQISSRQSSLETRIGQLYAGSTNVTKIALTTFNDVVAAASFTYENATYYAFYTKPNNAYKNKAMDIYVILDAEGKIAKVDIKEIFDAAKYFADQYEDIANFDEEEYKNKFVGIGSDSITDEAFEKEGSFHISSATKSSYGVKDALTSAYELFETLSSQGGNE